MVAQVAAFDEGRAPVWENYVIAQTMEASRGQIPEHALALEIEVDGLASGYGSSSRR